MVKLPPNIQITQDSFLALESKVDFRRPQNFYTIYNEAISHNSTLFLDILLGGFPNLKALTESCQYLDV